MSHFTKVQTKITDLDCLKQALEDLQYICREGEVRVRGWRGQWSQADLVADLGDPTILAFARQPRGITKSWLIGGAWKCGLGFPKPNSSMT